MTVYMAASHPLDPPARPGAGRTDFMCIWTEDADELHTWCQDRLAEGRDYRKYDMSYYLGLED